MAPQHVNAMDLFTDLLEEVQWEHVVRQLPIVMDSVIRVLLEGLWKHISHLMEIMDLVAKDFLEEAGLEGLQACMMYKLPVVVDLEDMNLL
jgi:hypothetical protein